MPEDKKSSRESSRERVEPPPKPKEEKRLVLQKNFLLLDDDELSKLGIVGFRFKLALALRSKFYDVFMIILIVFYTLLIFMYFTFDGASFLQGDNITKFYIFEICILGIFVAEILLHFISYRCLYFEDYWNIFDIIVIIISYIFVFLDMYVTNS